MNMISLMQFHYTKPQTTPLPLPAAGELHIWWADTECDPHKSGLSRQILTELLSGYLQIPAADIRISTGAHGKPCLAAETAGTPGTASTPASGPNATPQSEAAPAPLFFNLSHAGSKMVLVFSSSSEVGIDLESLDHAGDADRIAARFFHPDETRDLNRLSGEDRKKKFFSFWTQKEAFLKGTGEGLTRETNSFTFEPLPDGSLQIKKGLREGDASWRLCAVPAPDGYVCTAAWQISP